MRAKKMRQDGGAEFISAGLDCKLMCETDVKHPESPIINVVVEMHHIFLYNAFSIHRYGNHINP